MEDIITFLLIDFDEMGFIPSTLVPNPEEYAIEWRRKITQEINKLKEEKEKLKSDNNLFYQEQIKDRKKIEQLKLLLNKIYGGSVQPFNLKPYKDLTSKFSDMIISFEADFSLATLHEDVEYVNFRKLIEEGNERLLKDIELLEELSFGIRYGKIKIIETEGTK